MNVYQLRFLMLSLLLLGLNKVNSQVGIGTPSPDASAALDVHSTTKGFLPPRLSENDRDAMANLSVGLVIYNSDTDCIEFWGGNGWTSLCADVEPGDVLNPQTGNIWMDRNLGASQVAT
ncbi:MAG: hypothetical protein R6V37_06625, partial [Psychroflexus maritimus]